MSNIKISRTENTLNFPLLILVVNAHTNLDYLYGPYLYGTLDEPFKNIDVEIYNIIQIGKTVGIIQEDNTIKEYWWLKVELELSEEPEVETPANNELSENSSTTTQPQETPYEKAVRELGCDWVEKAPCASNFDIKDLTDSTNLKQTWSGKQDKLTPGTNISINGSRKISAKGYVYDDSKDSFSEGYVGFELLKHDEDSIEVSVTLGSLYVNDYGFSDGQIEKGDKLLIGDEICIYDYVDPLGEGFYVVSEFKKDHNNVILYKINDGVTALGEYSHCEGYNTITLNSSEHAEGLYNVSHYNSDDYSDSKNTQHSIGIGTDWQDRKNAFEVMQNGDIYIAQGEAELGDYDGTNAGTAKTLQQLIKEAYNVHAASNDTLGGIKTGYTQNGQNYPVKLDSNKAYVNVPWTDNNTWKANSSSSEGYVTSGKDQINKVWKTDANGNPGWRDDANTTYSAATSTQLGLVKSTSTGTTADRDYNVLVNSDGTMKVNVPWTDTNTTYNTFTKSGTGNSSGLVPAPGGTAGTTKFLREDCTWSDAYARNTSISDGNDYKDLNNYIDPGFYRSSGGGAKANTPFTDSQSGSKYFGLEVIRITSGTGNSMSCTLYFYPVGSNDVYKRYCLNNSWSSWEKLNFTNYSAGDNISISNNNISALGYTYDSEKNSFAEGQNTVASGEASHAEGYLTQAVENYSHAEGSGSIASNEIAHAEGDSTEASGAASHAEGNSTFASSYASHAEGDNTTASGDASHAEGKGTLTRLSNISSRTVTTITFSTLPGIIKIGSIIKDVTGAYAIVTNINTSTRVVTVNSNLSTTGDLLLVYGIAYGDYSHAEGDNTTAYGNASHAGGIGTIANQEAMTAIGTYNEELNDGGLFAIGNGTSNNRQNIIEVYNDKININNDIYFPYDKLLHFECANLNPSTPIHPGDSKYTRLDLSGNTLLNITFPTSIDYTCESICVLYNQSSSDITVTLPSYPGKIHNMMGVSQITIGSKKIAELVFTLWSTDLISFNGGVEI